MMNKVSLSMVTIMAFSLLACSGGSGASSPTPSPTPTPTTTPSNSLPSGYTCLPSGYSSISGNSLNSTKIAYGSNCEVSNVTDSTIKTTLSSMAVALSSQSGRRYCTGTPLSYDASTQTGFILTAAHCVVGNTKSANTKITTNNITTFSTQSNYINQTSNAIIGSGNTGTIEAVYVPDTYCQTPPFVLDSSSGHYFCGDLTEQYSDLAVIKVHSNVALQLNTQVKLATTSLQLTSPSYIMALGYGITNTDANNANLFYITYEYFGTNTYQGETGVSTIMTGYSPSGANGYYSIICGGDSGGGDFYWDGTNWQLVGVHSYGSSTCGEKSTNYSNAFDASADVRPFASGISQIINGDSSSSGCDTALAASSGFVCRAP